MTEVTVMAQNDQTTDRAETDREHGVLDRIYALAATGRSVSDAAELKVSLGVWVGVWVRAPYGRPALCLEMSCVSACLRVR
eukprot:3095733-Prymnesium_polylepis.1